MVSCIQRLKTGLERRLLKSPAESFWKDKLISLQESHDKIRSHVLEKKPFCAARLGAVELGILMWGKGIPQIGKFGLRVPLLFSETRRGASNAGIRPRTRTSYREFANLEFENLPCIDLMPTWSTPLEFAVLHHTDLHPYFCDVEQLSPTMSNAPHWVEALDGKRVLVVSPFKTSIERQIPELSRIWTRRPWTWKADFTVLQFPYLIDENCPQSWQDVWKEMLSVVKAGEYDVALFGCGGLGMPLAAAAKRAGRIGIHMGGHLQLLFGIYGQRHLEQEWHARLINESWIRPLPQEVAESAKRVENACYW